MILLSMKKLCVSVQGLMSILEFVYFKMINFSSFVNE